MAPTPTPETLREPLRALLAAPLSPENLDVLLAALAPDARALLAADADLSALALDALAAWTLTRDAAARGAARAARYADTPSLARAVEALLPLALSAPVNPRELAGAAPKERAQLWAATAELAEALGDRAPGRPAPHDRPPAAPSLAARLQLTRAAVHLCAHLDPARALDALTLAPGGALAAGARAALGELKAALVGAKDASECKPGALVADRYLVVEPLGAGGMGRVYAVEDTHEQGAPLALKVLPRPPQLKPQDWDAVARRFAREVELLRALKSPAVVRLARPLTLPSGAPAYLMERLRGQPLDAVLAAGPLPLARALSLWAGAVEAVAVTHEAQVLHRDLKPGNLMVEALTPHLDRVTLIDFGISKRLGADAGALTEGLTPATRAYGAPEQLFGDGDVTLAADVFALGVIACELLCGERLRDEAAALARLPAPLAPLAPLIAQTLRRDPAARPPAHDLRAALRRLYLQPPGSSRAYLLTSAALGRDAEAPEAASWARPALALERDPAAAARPPELVWVALAAVGDEGAAAARGAEARARALTPCTPPLLDAGAQSPAAPSDSWRAYWVTLPPRGAPLTEQGPALDLSGALGALIDLSGALARHEARGWHRRTLRGALWLAHGDAGVEARLYDLMGPPSPLGAAERLDALAGELTAWLARCAAAAAPLAPDERAAWDALSDWAQRLSQDPAWVSEELQRCALQRRYLRGDWLNRGGMGEVWLGRDLKRAGQPVVIKELSPDHAQQPEQWRQHRLRFLQEAKILMRVSSPRVLKYIDHGVYRAPPTPAEPQGREAPFLIMEYFASPTLKDHLSERLARRPAQAPFSPREAIELTAQLLEALAALHQLGVTHRDVKPANLLIAVAPGSLDLRLIDLGIAKHSDLELNLVHTRAGEVQGTLDFMTPEQIRFCLNPADGDPRHLSSPRLDLYAVGLILAALCASQRDLDANPAFPYNPSGLLRADTLGVAYHRTHAPLLDALGALPDDAWRLARELLLQTDPAARAADASEALARWRALLDPPAAPPPPPPRPPGAPRAPSRSPPTSPSASATSTSPPPAPPPRPPGSPPTSSPRRSAPPSAARPPRALRTPRASPGARPATPPTRSAPASDSPPPTPPPARPPRAAPTSSAPPSGRPRRAPAPAGPPRARSCRRAPGS